MIIHSIDDIKVIFQVTKPGVVRGVAHLRYFKLSLPESEIGTLSLNGCKYFGDLVFLKATTSLRNDYYVDHRFVLNCQ